MLERLVDDALTDAELHHKVHPSIGGSRYRADFLVDRDVYVEVWGLKDPDYQARRLKKSKAYGARRLKLVEIEEADCRVKRRLDAKLVEIVRKKGGGQAHLLRVIQPRRRPQRDGRITAYSEAEERASASGALRTIDGKIARLGRDLNDLSIRESRLRRLLKAAQEERQRIIRRKMKR